MLKQPVQVKFNNRQNPKAAFDIIRLEKLHQRTDLDHSFSELHRVAFYMIILITEGSGKHTIDFTDYTCQAGTLLTVRKDQVHKFFQHNSMKGKLLLFTDEFLVSYLEDLETQKTLQLFNELLGSPKLQLSKTEFQAIAALVERMQQEYLEINDAYSFSILRSELHILIAKLYRIKSQEVQIIAKRKYLNAFIEFQDLVEREVTKYAKVLDYAKKLGLSTKTLNTITRSIVNKTAKEFIDEIYTKQIKRLLINTEHSIKEIAYIAGFEETTNFYKYFKRQTQLTPEQFRNSTK
ncbi:MAG: helix-turn-helix transcriptional regulator [Saprospiraceae bacterium]